MKKSHAAVAPITGAGDELVCCPTARLIIKLTWVLNNNNNNNKGERNKTGMGKDNTGTGALNTTEHQKQTSGQSAAVSKEYSNTIK